jgi:hypothetical protein
VLVPCRRRAGVGSPPVVSALMDAGRRPRSGLLAQRQALIARQLGDTSGSAGDDVCGGSLAEQAAAQQTLRRSRMAVGTPRTDTDDVGEPVLRTWDMPAEQRPVMFRQEGDTVADRFLAKEEALAKLGQFARLVRQLQGEDRTEVTRQAVGQIETLVREAGLHWQDSAEPAPQRSVRRPPSLQESAPDSFTPVVPARETEWRGIDAESPTTQRRTRAAAAAEARAAAAARTDPGTVYANLYGPRPLDEPAYTHVVNCQERERGPSPDPQKLEDDDLVECRNCRRTFLPERLTVHLRSCRPAAGSRPISRVHRSGTTGSAADARASIQALGEAFSRLPPPSPSRPPARRPECASGVLIEAVATRAAPVEADTWIDYFSVIPDEVKVDILTYVGPPYGEASTLCKMARTCRWFSRLWREAVQSLSANDALCCTKLRVDGMPYMQYSGALWQMVMSCEDLRSIDLTSCRSIELIDDSIICPLVHTLCLRACVAIRSIEALGNPNLWPCLTDLDCTGCRALRMESLASVLSTAPALHTLNLSGMRALRSLAELCPPEISPSDVPVGTVDERTDTPQHEMPEVGLLSRLRHLDLACCRQLANVAGLEHCQGLLFLSLRECRALSSLSELSACVQLRELVLNGCRSLDPGALHQVGRCTSLVKLSISNIRGLTDIEGLRGCTQLERLDLGGCRTLRAINALSDLRQSLTWLNLHGCEKLDNISALAGSRALHTVNLSFCSGKSTYFHTRTVTYT